MKITVNRVHFTDESTIGELFVDDKFFCYTLEDCVREPLPWSDEAKKKPHVSDWKVDKQTAIARGTYRVIIDMSARFKRLMMKLLGTEGFTGVRIHGGNTAANTEGCILVGKHRGEDSIRDCEAVLTQLHHMVQEALNDGEQVWIEIK